MTKDLTLRPFLWRATNLFPNKEIVSRTHDDVHRYTYAEFDHRVRSLAAGLRNLGITDGDRVGTFSWNTHRHFEAYFGIPLLGAQLHTINLHLRDDYVAHIINDAADELLIVDPGEPFQTIERIWDDLDSVGEILIMADNPPETELPVRTVESLIAGSKPLTAWPNLDEDQSAGICYTSGTTGLPKGVEYTHKMIYAHAMMLMTPAAIGIAESDVVMPVVPMFHVNSWGFPYATTMAGAKQVYSGPSPEPADLVRLIESEGVTLSAGVPTVWIGVLDHLDEHGGDISSLERIIVGGSAAPEDVMRRYDDEYDVTIEHAWGMTETMSIGSVSRPTAKMKDWDREKRYAKRAKQGLLSPGLEMKIVNDGGEQVPWDGESFGELLIRGPTVIDAYYNRPGTVDEDFVPSDNDGRWLRTGDIATVDNDGYFEIVDRAKDVIKSGGEWISSIELENELMAHEDIAEAVVVAAPHDRWQERPLAFVVPRKGADLDVKAVRTFLDGKFPRWWLPDDVLFRESIPKTATGKFDKKILRENINNLDLPYSPGEEQ